MKIKKREKTSKVVLYSIPFLSILSSLIFVGILLWLVGVNPVEAYYVMFTRTFGSKLGLSELFVKTTPLILTGLAVAIPLKAGLWNIGAEGQLCMGAFIASFIALNLSTSLVIPIMFVLAIVFGAFWAFIPAILKAKFELNEIISTLLLNYIAIYWVEYMVYGPMRGKEVYNFPYSDLFPKYAILPRFFDTRLHLGVFIALLIVIVVHFIFKKTTFGFSVKVVGANPKAAEYAGIDRKKVIVYTMILGGAIAGIAGMVEISGIHHRLRAVISPGYGYAGIPIALLAKGNFLAIVLSAMLFGFLYVGGSALQTSYSIPIAVVYIFQSLVVLHIIAGEFFVRYKVVR